MERLLKEQINSTIRHRDYSQLKRLHGMERNTYNDTLSKMSYAFLALGTAENILVCVVLFKVSKVRTTRSTSKLSSFFILQLAITDLVFRAVNFFHKAFRKQVRLNAEQCKVTIFSVFTCAAVTFALLAGIAIDRYVHILFPIRTLSIKTRKYLVMLLIWIYALAICSGFIASATVSLRFPHRRRPLHRTFLNSERNNTARWDFKEPRKHCTPGLSGSLERKIAFTMYFLFAFVVPLFCVVFSYTKITAFLWRKAKTANFMNRGIARSKLRALRMFALVVLSFLLSWGPVMILDMINSYPLSRRAKITIGEFPLRPLFDCISQTSSILNPAIYAFGDTNFRRSLRLLFCVGKRASARINRVSPTKMQGTYIKMTNFKTRTPFNSEGSDGSRLGKTLCGGPSLEVDKRNVVFHKL